MVVYVCWTIPDYIGIDIEKIFLHEEDAIKWCDEFNSHMKYECEKASYDAFEVVQ